MTLTAKFSALSYTVPRDSQGQTVEVGYAWGDHRLVRRTLDRADRSVVYEVLADDAAAGIPPSWQPTNSHPPVPERAWRSAQ